MSIDAKWVIVHSHKLCPELINKIMTTHTKGKWWPKFLHRIILFFIQRFVKQKVIVQLNQNHHNSVIRLQDLEKSYCCKVDRKLDIIDGFATTVDLNTLRSLAANESVGKIWIDSDVEALLDIASPVVNAPAAWEQQIQGKGVGIAVLDTGIDPHPDLTRPNNRIIAFKDYVNNRPNPYDDNGHGTHCAGDAAGNGFSSSGLYQGPAPQANLIGVKVLDKRGSGQVSKVLAGIQWCIRNKVRYNIKVLSLSLGARARESHKNDPLCQSVKKAWEAGLVVCVAAGNEGPSAKTIANPGIEPKVITVGAIDDRNTLKPNDDLIARFSSRGPTIDGINKPDLVAPGANITSLNAPIGWLDRINSKWYATNSGTSMATPICAGVAALLLQKYPNLTPDEVKTRLTQSCTKLKADINDQGAGLINAQAALKNASRNIKETS